MITLTSTGTRYVYVNVRAVDPVTNEEVDTSGATWKMAFMRPNDRPDTADWVAATYVGESLVAGKAYGLARVLVGVGQALEPKPGQYTAWVQVSHGVEVVEEACGGVKVL